ncbi:RNA polymerase sigma factor [Pedobacter hiemivivus]|uniref:Sigma-70 family RNA polymerase sigma factor n=1 Tax=Pedobacter hiemivivus TaxID=2530454 RepID=A0A4R0NI78_9SPHI|nr:sigma-70 family RNA polymerase sigma factor [Pedobacter hiemivivus]TCC98514.1 sigma-70 family RNA polymerase sigma factor [Pedobacter hiemivivus]
MAAYSTLSILELTALLKNSDERSFSELYKIYSTRIYSNLKRLTKDDELAKELLQEVFFKVWEKREALNVEISFQAYLYKISENMVRDFFRKASRDKKLMEHLINAASEMYNTVEDLYISKENQSLFQKAIDELPPQRKRIFTLCKIEGKSYDEVSQLLGISNSTINDHIVKATKAIRMAMGGTGHNAMISIAASLILMNI